MPTRGGYPSAQTDSARRAWVRGVLCQHHGMCTSARSNRRRMCRTPFVVITGGAAKLPSYLRPACVMQEWPVVVLPRGATVAGLSGGWRQVSIDQVCPLARTGAEPRWQAVMPRPVPPQLCAVTSTICECSCARMLLRPSAASIVRRSC